MPYAFVSVTMNEGDVDANNTAELQPGLQQTRFAEATRAPASSTVYNENTQLAFVQGVMFVVRRCKC